MASTPASTTSDGRRRVAIVTGGGAGIGAAIAEELGRRGSFVITMDPLVSVDGTEQLPSPEETTAGRIVATGGSARASAVSVTDREAVRRLFADTASEFGTVDAVVNVAGITRPTSFTRGTDADWRSVLSVHLDGYLNVVEAAFDVMASAGHGHILGVTSGSGWRSADTGAYGCAKRAVASLTWQLGHRAPAGVVVNAISPIAMTRMVANALKGRAASSGTGSSGSGSKAPQSKNADPKEERSKEERTQGSRTGGLSLGSMPAPEELGPFAAHLVDAGFSACRGQVLFTAGAEVAVIEGPRLLEVLGVPGVGRVDGDTGGADTDGTGSVAQRLDTLVPGALVPAELHQRSGGGSNARFSASREGAEAADPAPSLVHSCVVVTDGSPVGDASIEALVARGVTCHRVAVGVSTGFARAADVLAESGGEVDAVVIALAQGSSAEPYATEWGRVLAEHDGIVEHLHTDAAWTRAVADRSAQTERPVRLVTLTDATTAGGRSRAQSSAQLARSARRATDDRVTAFAVSIETDESHLAGEFVAHLLCSPEATPLSGAELVVMPGSIGLRSHPQVRAGLVMGSGAVPDWLDDALSDIVDGGGPQ